ncbi:hypothetical protein ACH5RR_023633 [Cinchona calisaya]|uniref:Reverse transcriptase zinc-binding domain-containing protein n=1 Tax=Cinchona calisaya TaxID=153742 RepID=A0ABD2ZD34_9GENT
MNAALGNNPSLTWHGIIQGKKALGIGCRKRVGNSDSIFIWKDKWLPKPRSFKICIPPNQLPPSAKVIELIYLETQKWNEELVKDIFWEEEANIILSILLSSRLTSNQWVWHYSKNGKFSMKSCYHAVMGLDLLELDNIDAGSSSLGPNVAWKKIWSLNVPNKCKITLWRMCNNSLPTLDNLMRRGVVIDSVCPLCNHESSDLNHILFKCPAALQL